MKLKDLNQDERLAFVGLAKYILEADGRLTTPEADGVMQIAEAFGAEEYRGLLATVEAEFSDGEKFRAYLKTIERPEARQLITRYAKELADLDSVSVEEEHIIDWISEAWGIY